MAEQQRPIETGVPLHDCEADRISLSGGVLTFRFSNGLWLDPHNAQGVRTEEARVSFPLEGYDPAGVEVCVFPVKFRRTRRERWSVDRLCRAVNGGKYRLEFLDAYMGYRQRLYRCRLNGLKKREDMDCELLIPAREVICRWDRLQTEQDQQTKVFD